MDQTPSSDPASVWQLVVRADELRKYAGNRDPGEARAQALDVLRKAADAASALTDRAAAASLAAQIRRRIDDLEGGA